MAILPVLDILDGAVVRGMGGRRENYRPIVSRWTSSARPIDVARALASHFGFDEFYLADLDAIAGHTPSLTVYEALHRAGFKLWVDAGIRSTADAAALTAANVATLVAGMETIDGPDVLQALVTELGWERVVFSLDLKAGQVLGNKDAWPSAEPFAVAQEAVARGIRRLLILDLARVGSGAGTGTEELCRRLAAAHPDVRIAAGGGIDCLADVRRLESLGVETVLVASALHDGRVVAID